MYRALKKYEADVFNFSLEIIARELNEASFLNRLMFAFDVLRGRCKVNALRGK